MKTKVNLLPLKTRIALARELFSETPRTLVETKDFKAIAFRFKTGVEALRIENCRGYLVVLPWMGQMIWDAVFDGHDLTMKNMFREPKQTNEIIGTYGCFAFHSGLIANGCPAPDDNHPLHGEFPCARMDDAWIELDDSVIRVTGQYEYVMGFGAHYIAQPLLDLDANNAFFNISMKVMNAASVPMPLQYMCHMNYAYVPGATLSQNFDDSAWQLRESIPAHVKPTEQWLNFNDRIKAGSVSLKTLDNPEFYDPEIVFFVDDLHRFGESVDFKMTTPGGTTFFTRFNSAELNHATRWILRNEDQQVAAFALPATCRPEGHSAAKRNGSLIMLEAGETRTFSVTTGILP